MTKLHKIYFLIWKAVMGIKGIKKGAVFFHYSTQKGIFIKGVLTSFSGESVTNRDFDFSVYIEWDEPLQTGGCIPCIGSYS